MLCHLQSNAAGGGPRRRADERALQGGVGVARRWAVRPRQCSLASPVEDVAMGSALRQCSLACQ